MTPAFMTAVVVAFFGALMSTFVGLLGFFAVRWIKSLDLSAEKLSTAIERLTDSVVLLDKKMDLMDRDMKAHDEAILRLQSRGCPSSECPLREHPEEPHPRLARTRAEDLNG